MASTPLSLTIQICLDSKLLILKSNILILNIILFLPLKPHPVFHGREKCLNFF
jgi:hypothetical protein